MSNKDRAPYCCYCGFRPAETKDHVPPKCIFNKPRTSDLLTVPSCKTCNSGFSSDDELFKLYLGLHVARFGGNGEMFFKKGAVPTLKRKKNLTSEIINTAGKFFINNCEFNILTWDSKVHDSVIERITKGLFFHHYKRRLGQQCEIEVNWFFKPPELDLLNEMNIFSMSDGNFKYCFVKAENCDYSIWIFEFYQSHWAGATIID